MIEPEEPIISNSCFLTYPCMHHVTYKGETKMMGGVEIFNLFASLGKEIPKHFQLYEFDGKFEVSQECYETDPCRHDVTIEGRKYTLDGNAIKELYGNRNLPIPDHFKYYGTSGFATNSPPAPKG